MKARNKQLLQATIVAAFLLNSSSIFSQVNGEYKDMTKFDTQAFQQNKKGAYWIQTFNDGTTIRQSELAGVGYAMEITNIKSPFREKKAFNFQGGLVASGKFFYSFPIGTSINYDDKGNIINQTNHDQAFSFSLDDVAKKMRTEFHVDIMNRETVPSVSRSVDQRDLHIPYYIVYAVDPKEQTQRIAYLIHGGTGEVLFTRTMDIYSNDGLVLRGYAEMLKQKQAK